MKVFLRSNFSGIVPREIYSEIHDFALNGVHTTLSVMTVCNSESLLWNVLAKYQGAHHHNFIFSRSQL